MTPALDAYLQDVEARCEQASREVFDSSPEWRRLVLSELLEDQATLLQLVRWQQEAIESVLKDSEHNPLAELLRHQPGSSYVKLEAVLARIEQAVGEADGP